MDSQKELEDLTDEIDLSERKTLLSEEDSLEEIIEPLSYITGADGGDYFDDIIQVGAVSSVEEELDYITKEDETYQDSIAEFIWTHKGSSIKKDPWFAFCKMKNGVYTLLMAKCGPEGFLEDGTVSLTLSDTYESMLLFGMSKKVYELFIEETE